MTVPQQPAGRVATQALPVKPLRISGNVSGLGTQCGKALGHFDSVSPHGHLLACLPIGNVMALRSLKGPQCTRNCLDTIRAHAMVTFGKRNDIAIFYREQDKANEVILVPYYHNWQDNKINSKHPVTGRLCSSLQGKVHRAPGCC